MTRFSSFLVGPAVVAFFAFAIPPSPPTPLHPRRGGKGGQQPYLAASFDGSVTRRWAVGQSLSRGQDQCWGMLTYFHKELTCSPLLVCVRRSLIFYPDGPLLHQKFGIRRCNHSTNQNPACHRPTPSGRQSATKNKRPNRAVSSPFRPGGGGEGLGVRGGLQKLKNPPWPSQPQLNPRMNWNLTPINLTSLIYDI